MRSIEVDTPRPNLAINVGSNVVHCHADFDAKTARWCCEEELRVREAFFSADTEEEEVALVKPLIVKVVGEKSYCDFVEACGTDEVGAADSLCQLWENLVKMAYERRENVLKAAMERFRSDEV